MKRVLLIGVAAILLAAGVGLADGEVPSVNVVGYGKVAIGPDKLVLVATTFETFGDAKLEDLVGGQLPEASVAYVWDRVAKGYQSSTMLRSGSWSTNLTILRGDAFWLKNAGTQTNEVALRGEVPYDYNNSATTTVANITGVDAVAYAYPTDVLWTNTALAQACVEGDVLYIWNGAMYDSYTMLRAGWPAAAQTVVIEAGRAFFINTSQNINWTEVAPYDL